MIKKEFLDYLGLHLKTANLELVEKDIILHRLIISLANNKDFVKNYAFKGGTCLMKCYLGYYRFSEDLDFTWIDQSIFENKSSNQQKAALSKEINFLAESLESLAKQIGLDFKAHKSDSHYCEFRAGNLFATFKLWYMPYGMNEERFIKIQVNYKEELQYPLIKAEAKSSLEKGIEKEASFYFPKESEWVIKNPIIPVYDLREILCEKVRAILTRQGTKARDFIDLYEIEKQKMLKIEEFENQIIKKIEAMLRFNRYKIHLQTRANQASAFILGEESRLLLKPISSNFTSYVKRIEGFLGSLSNKIIENYR